MKNARQAEILRLIREFEIDTQDQLLEKLKQHGFSATQATISRDIKELRLVKELGKNGYRYVQFERRVDGETSTRLRNIFREGVLSVDVAQNIVVLRTMPGLASGACSALDNMEVEGMVGTLAGDDTAVLIMRDNNYALAFDSRIHTLFE